MNYPLNAFSWQFKSSRTAVKSIDKSVFTQGTAIPRQGMGFFGWTATPDNHRHEIVLRYQGTEYEARIEQTVHDRYRLFWPKFARQVQSQWPDLYAQVRAGGHVGEPAPLIEFNRVATDIYEIEFLNAVESDGVTAEASKRGPRVWWVNQSDSWDVESGDGVV